MASSASVRQDAPSQRAMKEWRLKNGLRVLHRQEKAAPVVAVCVVYRVGSRNEAVGHTGSTHILEHLLFKDSKRFTKAGGNSISEHLERLGAMMNATTSFDRTNYFELLPREHFEEALAVEADRMRGSLFCEEDLRAEMTVVRNEYERGRNNPFELLNEHLWAAAFLAHPYHHPTIGWREDIEQASAERLREFYDRFYWPDNATLIIVGDVSAEEARAAAESHFAEIAASPQPASPVHVVEPPQEGARLFELRRPGAVSAAALAYKVPAATHKDFPALFVLSQVLAGGLSSRLQKVLVDTGRAADVSAALHALRDPGLLELFARATQKEQPQEILKEMRAQCQALGSKRPPSAAEVARAKNTLLAQFAFARDGVLSEAMELSEALAAGDWTLAYRLETQVAAVTPADVAAAARTYLIERGETAGIFIGEKGAPPQRKKKSR